MLEEIEVVYERLINEVKHLVLKGVVNYVQKRTYELGVANPWEIFVIIYEDVYHYFYFELQRVHLPKGSTVF